MFETWANDELFNLKLRHLSNYALNPVLSLAVPALTLAVHREKLRIIGRLEISEWLELNAFQAFFLSFEAF